jgi:hypothetical protein
MRQVTKIRAINAGGWFIRVSLSDGQERDIPLLNHRRAPSARRARAEAADDGLMWHYTVPRGVPVVVGE